MPIQWIKSDGWYPLRASARGGYRSFAEVRSTTRVRLFRPFPSRPRTINRLAKPGHVASIDFARYPGGKPISGATFGTSQDASRR